MIISKVNNKNLQFPHIQLYNFIFLVIIVGDVKEVVKMKKVAQEMKNNLIIFITLLCSLSLIVLLSIYIGINNINNKAKIRLLKDKIEEQEKLTDKTKKYIRELNKNENIVFLGDSITEIYPIREIYGDKMYINQGVSGYTTNDILDRMPEMVYKYNPTKVILLIGTNDISKEASEEKQKEIVQNIKKIHQDIKKNRPSAKLYIESLYPVNRNMDKKMVYHRTNEVIKQINERIKKYCEEEKITYINLYDDLTDKNGDFDENYTYDGLHPSVLGYAKITKLLIPYVYE